TIEARLARQVQAFVGQRRNDARRRDLGETRFVRDLQHLPSLGLAQCVRRRRSLRCRSAIAALKPATGTPALQRTDVDTCHLTGWRQPRSGSMCFVHRFDDLAAVFQADHSSSSPWKTAESFFESTNSAALSASALSLRLSSRSSALIRRRSLRVCSGVARASPASASALAASVRHFSRSRGYTPCSRHHPLRADSSIDAVAITASSRASAVHVRSRPGSDSASARQRSSVSARTPNSDEIFSTELLSGGNNRATARRLNSLPYRATCCPPSPQRVHSLGGDNYPDTGGLLSWHLRWSCECIHYCNITSRKREGLV